RGTHSGSAPPRAVAPRLRGQRVDRCVARERPAPTLRLRDHARHAPAPEACAGAALEAPTPRRCPQAPAPGPERGRLVRRLNRGPPGPVIRVLDATICRWFPPPRAAWALRGQQARVPITGPNAKRTLWGAINIRTGHRVVGRSHRMRQEDFQVCL